MKKLAIVLSVATLAGVSNAAVLWNQQSLINGSHPSGSGSIWGSPQTSSSANIRTSQNQAVADNFTVAGDPWTITMLSFYAFQPQQNGINHSFTFTSATWQIVAGDVNTGTVVHSGAANAVTNGGFLGYRASDAQAANNYTDQPIYRVNVAVNNLALGPGSYYLRWSLAGSLSTAPAQPYNVPVTSGNGYYKSATSSTFTPYANPTGSVVHEWPFTIEGSAVPEPGTMIALAGGLGALVARRRRK